MRIHQVSFADWAGGAEKVAWDLLHAYLQDGHDSWLFVGQKRSQDARVIEIDHDRYRAGVPAWLDKIWRPFRKFEVSNPTLRLWRRRSIGIVDRKRIKNKLFGLEDFEFPGTTHLLDLLPARPDVLHCHNLHGNYFDLRQLPLLSRELPLVLTLQDAWLLAGHCAHSFDCERWLTGCGHCPDLTIPPKISRDATSANWNTKRDIFLRSRFHVVTPSWWLMDKVKRSIVAPGAITFRVIPNAVDLSVFHPEEQGKARELLGIPHQATVLLMIGSALKTNVWKDYATAAAALQRVAADAGDGKLLFVCVGEDRAPERIGSATVWFVKPERNLERVARFYQAADIYLHAAKVDTFPCAVLEAMACGKPVIATAVGGIPEQVEDNVTGCLVPMGDSLAMAGAVRKLLAAPGMRRLMGDRATERATRRFSLEQQSREYLNVYREACAEASPARIGT